MRSSVAVLGPAYTDTVLTVDRPLVDADALTGHIEAVLATAEVSGPTRAEIHRLLDANPFLLDYSLTEAGRERTDDDRLRIVSPSGQELVVEGHSPSSELAGLGIAVAEEHLLARERLVAWFRTVLAPFITSPAGVDERMYRQIGCFPHRRICRLQAAECSLGGMGAGFAAALGAALMFPVGATAHVEPDADARSLIALLNRHGVANWPAPVPGAVTDLTLLVASPPGDKLPIGRRSASASFRPTEHTQEFLRDRELTVFASLTNAAIAASAKDLEGVFVAFAPSARNMREAQPAVEEFAARIDYLALNRTEFALAHDQARLRNGVPLITITDGARDVEISYHEAPGRPVSVSVPCISPRKQVVNPNRAGEAYAAGFLLALMELVGLDELKAGHFERDVIKEAGLWGAISADLELDMATFGFPSLDEIRAARRALRF